KAHDIGPVPYDMETYLANAGIVEIPVPKGMAPLIASGTLQIDAPQAPFVPGTPAAPLLVESTRVAETDDRATYITLGEKATITVNLRDHGVPAAPGVAVAV